VAGIPFTTTQSACSFGPSAGSANVAGVQLLINQALGKQSPANDLNKDGVVNVVDIQIEIDAVLGTGCAAS
jgi:phage terminase small subunit